MIELNDKVGELAARYPLCTRVFARHGIDFCCGGGKALGEVCNEKGIEGDSFLREIENELESSEERPEVWQDAPLAKLIEHIIKAYHEPLREELPRLEEMGRRVLTVHGNRDPERLESLAKVFLKLQSELLTHMAKEEEILFPSILSGCGKLTGAPISVMLNEHEDAGEALRQIRELTDDFTVPPSACNTWNALWKGLEALEGDLHMHIHLENNILFPRALRE